MAACSWTIEWKLPRWMRLRVSAEKNVSTAFSYDPEVGVRGKVQRGSLPGPTAWLARRQSRLSEAVWHLQVQAISCATFGILTNPKRGSRKFQSGPMAPSCLN